MGDECVKMRRKTFRRVIIASALLVVLATLAFVVYVPIRSTRVMREFGILWNTTDAIQMYVDRNHKWPRNWGELSSSLIAVNVTSSDLRDSVVVNFDVDYE